MIDTIDEINKYKKWIKENTNIDIENIIQQSKNERKKDNKSIYEVYIN